VIRHSTFSVEPWTVRETELDLDKLAQAEPVREARFELRGGG